MAARVLIVTSLLITIRLADVVALGAPDEQNAKKTKGLRWAIIAAEASLVPTADILTARLSAWPGLTLVERAEIPRVLAELKLSTSGLVKTDRALRLGELLNADALLVLEPVVNPALPVQKPNVASATPNSESLLLRIRLIEVRTGVRMLDALIPRKGLEAELDSIEAELRQARVKIALPQEKRHYVGVMPFKSEEAGDTLNPLGQALAILVAADLHRRDGFIVLERDQLRQLQSEEGLTGIELNLRASSQLIEGGLRREEAGMILSCQIASPGGRNPHRFSVKSESMDVSGLHAKLMEGIAKAVDAAPLESGFDLKAEARLIAKRRDQFRGSFRYDETLELAEAAFALNPTPDNATQLLSACDAMARNGRASNLKAARRFLELRLDWLRRDRTDPLSKVAEDFMQNAFQPHVRIPVQGESAEDRQLRNEVDQLSLDVFEELLAMKRADTRMRMVLLLERIQYSAYLAKDGKEFAKSLPSLIASYLDALKVHAADKPSNDRPGASQYQDFVLRLTLLMNQSDMNCQRAGRLEDQREWDATDLVGLWRQLSKHEDPIVRLAGNRGQLSLMDSEGRTAAIEAFQLAVNWPTKTTPNIQQTCDFAADLALRRLAATREKEEHDLVESLLARAEKQGPHEVVRFRSAMVNYLGRVSLDKKREFVERVSKILAADDAAPDQIAGIASLRNQIQSMARAYKLGAVARIPELSLESGGPAWQGFEARSVVVRTPEINPVDLHAAKVVPGADGKDDLLLLWPEPSEKYSIERMTFLNPPPRQIGPQFPGRWDGNLGHNIVVSPDAIFVTSAYPALVTLKPPEAEVTDESRGLPTRTVKAAAWLDGRLYLGYQNGIAAYDPANKTFRILASSTAIDQKSPLDGNGFFVNGILVDTESKSIWLSITGTTPTKSVNGIWRYEPAKEDWQFVEPRSEFTLGPVVKTRGGLMTSYEEFIPSTRKFRRHWLAVDFKERKAISTSQYAPWNIPENVPFSRQSTFIQWNDLLITADGQLFTPQQTVHRVQLREPWTLIANVGAGFLASYNKPTGQLWYIMPKDANKPGN